MSDRQRSNERAITQDDWDQVVDLSGVKNVTEPDDEAARATRALIAANDMLPTFAEAADNLAEIMKSVGSVPVSVPVEPAGSTDSEREND